MLVGGGDPFEQVGVALVGRGDVERQRPERRVAGLLEHDRLADVVEPEATELDADVGRQQPGGAAFATSSNRNSSVGPCWSRRVSPSIGIISSRTNAAVRSRRSASSAVGAKSITAAACQTPT